MDKLQQLMNDISEWSDATFGDGQRNPAIVHHLKKEVDELLAQLKKSEVMRYDNSVGIGAWGRQWSKTLEEYADCFMLLLDSAKHFNMTADDLIKVTKDKLEINKQRKWGKPDANGVVEHIKKEDNK
jgi:NTP pyrophosphatase (non-canonical NTP hydrolase)